MKKTNQTHTLELALSRVCRTVYLFIGFYALSIIIFDAGNLITRDVVINRWTLAFGLLIVNTVVWFLASRRAIKKSVNTGFILTTILSLSTIVFAGLMTYWERGMASTSTIFYILPLLIIAIQRSRHAILAIATLSAGTYAFAAVKYFNDFFNEGLRIQLWGSLLLYMGTIFVSAWLINIIARQQHNPKP